MTPRERVLRAQRTLALTVVATALLWAAAVAMAVVIVAAVLDEIRVLPVGARPAIIPITLGVALAGGAIVIWRGRAARSLERVALWIEEHEPWLQFALVTAIDPAVAPPEAHAELHAIAGRTDVEGLVRATWRRSVGRASIAVVLMIAVMAIVQPGDLWRRAELALARGAGSGASPIGNRLAGYTARIVPPPYSRLSAQTLRAPTNIAALTGSRIVLEGSGSPRGITATLDSARIAADSGLRGWAVNLAMPRSPAVAALHDRAYRQLVTLEPRIDSAPYVRLELPANDTTYPTVPRGPLRIAAALTDDIGLHYAYVEYLITKGGGENFKTRQVTSAQVQFGNARSGSLATTIALDTMQLGPGDVVHIRVVAYDYNDVTGPGQGVSETRTLKIADVADSTSVNAAPPIPIDSMWISQRLLNMKTDTLIRTRRRYTHGAFAHTSSGYSNAQEAIRQKALAVIGILENTGEGSSFETETSRKLREAADLMWTAREDLGIALPDSAMPYMKKILKILDELRLANRYYLRGILKPVPVDIARVRLTGKDSIRPGPRLPRARVGDANAVLAARLAAAAALAHHEPQAALDSLVYIRVAALTAAPSLAVQLQRAIDLMRESRPADSALARARLALEPPARVLAAPADWGGVLP